jgi:hypothetical protein
VGKQQKPKVDTKPVDNNRRANGKKPKQNPKTIKRKGGTMGGYSPAALDRRAARRSPVTLGGLRDHAAGSGGHGGTDHGAEGLTA